MKLVITINSSGSAKFPDQDYKIMYMLNHGFELLSHSIGGGTGSTQTELLFQKEIGEQTDNQSIKVMRMEYDRNMHKYVTDFKKR